MPPARAVAGMDVDVVRLVFVVLEDVMVLVFEVVAEESEE